MTPRAVAAIRADFAVLAADPDGLARDFYARLFALAPDLRPLFRGDLREQGSKLTAMLALVVRGLDRLDALAEPVRALGRRHVAYGVRPEDYAVVGHALLDTLERRLPAFGEEARAAWAEAFALLADLMTTEPARAD